ncbi:hypothetical protein TNCV_54741 [Trichonephila clavipes]|nr:hypothetical protein TNCV_54741 [Trichonephila clavipes]
MGRSECGRTQLEVYPEELESHRVSSPGFGNDSGTICAFVSGRHGAKCFFMDDNVRPHCASIVDECL